MKLTEILTTLLLGAIGLPAVAQNIPGPGTIDYTYAQGNPGGYGKGKKETIDVAMCIDDPGTAGMKLTGFKAYISGTEGISGTSLWLTKELTIENKVNVPDVGSYDVTPTTENFAGTSFGVLDVTLPEPYVLTGEPLYLGYTLTVDDTAPATAQAPIVLSRGVTNPNGFWLHMSKSILRWLQYDETAEGPGWKGGVAYIVARLEGELPSNSLGISGHEPINSMPGEPFRAVINVINSGRNDVETVKFTYSYDDSAAIYEGSATPPQPIPPALMTSTPLTLEIENGLTAYGHHTLNVTITEVNGRPNEAPNGSMACGMDVIPFLPTHRPLMEEYTGLWCGWCPGGYIAMQMIEERYGDRQLSITYHYDDPMEVTKNFPMNVSGYPNSSIDRRKLINPYYGSDEVTQFGIAYDLEDAMAVEALSAIDVQAELVGDEVKATASVRFIRDMEGTDYEVGFVLTASGLTDRTWRQENYYAGRTDYRGTPLEVLTTWPERVSGLVFDDVAVDVSGMMGVKGSIPANIVTNDEYITSISYDISGNSLVQHRDNMAVAAYVINKKTGRIDNACKYDFKTGSSSGVEAAEADVVAREYYDLHGRRVNRPGPGIHIRVDRLSDGSSRSAKVALR